MPFPVRSRGSIPARKVFFTVNGDPLTLWEARTGWDGIEVWKSEHGVPPLALCHLRVYRALRKRERHFSGERLRV